MGRSVPSRAGFWPATRARATRLLPAVGVLPLAAALLSGCGGGSSSGAGSYSVSAAVSGLSGTVVVAQGSSTLSFTADGTQTFSGMLAAGSAYAVTVSTQPATQYCAVNNGAGNINADITVAVSCNASAGGIWTGTGQNGDTYVAMADESGDLWLLDATNDANGDVYVYGGTLTVSGAGANASVSVSDTGEALSGSYSDGSYYGSGTMSGTVDPRSALTLTSTFKTTAGTQLPQTPLALTYSSLYAQGSSFADIAGVYSEGTTSFDISSAGVLFAQDSTSGCVLNGNVDPIVSTYNLYRVQYTYSNCTGGTNNPLNGLTFDGIGALAPANSTLNSTSAPHFIAVEASSLSTGYVYEALNLGLE